MMMTELEAKVEKLMNENERIININNKLME